MSDIIGQEIAVGDKGFVKVVDVMGGDHSVVQAARVSYGAGTKSCLLYTSPSPRDS